MTGMVRFSTCPGMGGDWVVVDLTRDAETHAIITPAMYKQLDALEAQVMSGKIKVKSAFQ